jgi:hypothetical protein
MHDDKLRESGPQRSDPQTRIGIVGVRLKRTTSKFNLHSGSVPSGTAQSRHKPALALPAIMSNVMAANRHAETVMKWIQSVYGPAKCNN